jgi:hypothetical protein
LFVKTKDRMVNLQNVSNVNILTDRNRVIFNLNYNIEITTGQNRNSKLISDYVYWDADNENELKNNIAQLFEHDYFFDNFLTKDGDKGFININEISSIKFIDSKKRVIFNMSHPVTFKDFDGNNKITSEFVYVNCKNLEQYKDYIQYVENKLGVN